MTLFSYVVARDYGFAPNPFGQCCTLATCKPDVRRFAQVGDWVVGTGSASNNRAGYLVYAMQVSETMTFDGYWNDPRFQYKRPSLEGSAKVAFGDNIYHRVDGGWAQADSHHSYEEGVPNIRNIRNDTRVDRVLIGRIFAYWGGNGPLIPANLRSYEGHDLCIGRGYKRYFPAGMEACFVEWFSSLGATGYLGRPIDW
ncbi:hypothetical protein [Burkholderia sp. USMB20]|uniref:Nmad2 family putative nucleotide modification protein n=1 Tax=Burkholderia sp. USMB20 TaxID=1571773 RepID=UPI0009E1FEE5|nr:hypothetical protein [Burkholderia sp. USMB20]TGN95621.1 hypothetical protein PL79_021175 [Burkholderia sp. USMB20]